MFSPYWLWLDGLLYPLEQITLDIDANTPTNSRVVLKRSKMDLMCLNGGVSLPTIEYFETGLRVLIWWLELEAC